MAESLHIVHDRRTHIETEHGGKIGRLNARIGTLALERFDQAGFLAANIGTCAAMHVDFQIIASAQNILP